ncbi:hypothetical protein ACFLRX_01740 [Acidobacteriota bacterium]
MIVHEKESWHYVIDSASLGEGDGSNPRRCQGFEKGEDGNILSLPPSCPSYPEVKLRSHSSLSGRLHFKGIQCKTDA